MNLLSFTQDALIKLVLNAILTEEMNISPNSQYILQKKKKKTSKKWQHSYRVIQAELKDIPKSSFCSDQGFVWQSFPQAMPIPSGTVPYGGEEKVEKQQ